MARKKVSDVFTPRMAEVNQSMYVARPDLEKRLQRSFAKNIHTLLYGESGNGKSWLYKTVLEQASIPYRVVNCANASRSGSLTEEIHRALVGAGAATKTEYQEEKSAKANALFAEGSLSHTGTYKILSEEPLFKAFESFYSAHPGSKILVLDNLESIFASKERMQELADIIILLDDADYGKFNVKFLIVGVPNGVLEYYSKVKNLASVANRIDEMPKVGGLSLGQIGELVKAGFDQLDVKITQGHRHGVATHTYEICLGVAQRAHEYLECLAYAIEENGWLYDPTLLDKADEEWLQQRLRECYQVIDSHLNSRNNDVARRNQVIFTIGRQTGHSFDSGAIEAGIRREFPATVPQTHMGIGSILSKLSAGSTPLLVKQQNGKDYCVCDPRYLMCIRVMLYKESSSSKVVKRRFRF